MTILKPVKKDDLVNYHKVNIYILECILNAIFLSKDIRNSPTIFDQIFWLSILSNFPVIFSFGR